MSDIFYNLYDSCNKSSTKLNYYKQVKNYYKQYQKLDEYLIQHYKKIRTIFGSELKSDYILTNTIIDDKFIIEKNTQIANIKLQQVLEKKNEVFFDRECQFCTSKIRVKNIFGYEAFSCTICMKMNYLV